MTLHTDTDGSRPLPDPASEELQSLLSSETQRLLYGLLYRRSHSTPPTMVELRAFAADALGEHDDRNQAASAADATTDL